MIESSQPKSSCFLISRRTLPHFFKNSGRQIQITRIKKQKTLKKKVEKHKQT